MHYEIVEASDGWVVLDEDRELARFLNQGAALADVAERLGDADASLMSSLSIRYRVRVA